MACSKLCKLRYINVSLLTKEAFSNAPFKCFAFYIPVYNLFHEFKLNENKNLFYGTYYFVYYHLVK